MCGILFATVAVSSNENRMNRRLNNVGDFPRASKRAAGSFASVRVLDRTFLKAVISTGKRNRVPVVHCSD